MKKLCVLLAALMGLTLLSGCHISINGEGTFETYKNSEKYQAGNFTYETAGIREVEIHWVSGQVEIRQEAGERLSVSEEADNLKEEQQLHYLLDGDTLIIRYCRSGYIGRINGKAKKLNVAIPEGVNLTVKTVSSDVYADSLVLEELEVETVSGETEIGSLSAQTLRIDTVSGDVSVRLEDCEEANLESVSGELELSFAEELGLTVEFSSVSGELETAREYLVRNKKSIFGAGGCEVDAETVSGDLVIR